MRIALFDLLNLKRVRHRWNLALIVLSIVSILTKLRTLLWVWSVWGSEWGGGGVSVFGGVSLVVIKSVDIVKIHFVKHLLILSVLWLVLFQFHLCHLWIKVCQLLGRISFHLRLFLLSLVLCLLLGLDGSELVENILIVKNCVWEFILEVVFVQKLLNSISDAWVLQNVINVWPFIWVSIKHGGEEVLHVLAEVGGHLRVLTLNDLLSKLMKTLSVEGWLEGTHLVEKNTKGPNIRLKAVWLGLNNFWG